MAKSPAATTKDKPLGRAVLVTTEFKGVFFGYADDTKGEIITLRRARNCVYWDSAVKGFLGLAQEGPSSGCRIGPFVDSLDLRKITAVAEVTPAAADKWENAPWSR